MDIGGLLSSPIGIGIAVIAGLVLLYAAWKINKFAIKLLVILILAAIAAAVLFFRKGGF
jgi:tryptophan-rich sensory protein